MTSNIHIPSLCFVVLLATACGGGKENVPSADASTDRSTDAFLQDSGHAENDANVDVGTADANGSETGVDACAITQANESACGDGMDNDCDGLVDCTDPNCVDMSCGAGTLVCNQQVCQCPRAASEKCDDGIDNDRDGQADCNDTDCDDRVCDTVTGSFCAGFACVCGGQPGRETSCTDGRDNDCDHAVDCADPDCAGTACENICHDGNDNDHDGQADCNDSDCDGKVCDRAMGYFCAGFACVCGGEPGGEVSCRDGIDNDCDHLTDCADPDCAGL